MDVAAPHQCHRETGACVTPVSKMRLQTADMCCHAAEMHSGSTGDKMETASADHLTLHEGAWRCMAECTEVNSCAETCIRLIPAIKIA